MADSDNSRTLSPVTGGEFHSLLAAALPTSPSPSLLETALLDAPSGEPAVAAWRAWWAICYCLTGSDGRQQQIEGRLLSMDDPLRSDSLGNKGAYRDALEAEARAAVAETEATSALWQTPAGSIAGVTAKLHAAVTKWQPSPAWREEPWPQIRAVIADLVRIDSAFAAGGGDRLLEPELQSVFQKC